ncbi:MAG: T9SS type A sorting domain-containing protein [Calditrichaeota bacterium]|nr:T9SS type A sorting domain-containing protein [Calditrichota bacterium]
MKKMAVVGFYLLVLMFCLGGNTFAATKISSQSGNWSSATTWGGSPPVAGDDVIILGDFTVTVDIPNAACLSIQLGGSVLNAGTGTLLFSSGSRLTVFGAVNIGPFNNNSTEGSLSMAAGGTLTCEGLIVGRLGTWDEGTGTIELTATNTLPNDNSVIYNNLTLSGGTTFLPGNIDVHANLLINSGATLDGGANTLTLGGDWTNNGTFNGNAGRVNFSRNGNQTIAGAGLNNFNLIRVDMGTSATNTLEVLSTHFNAADPFLTIVNGTFKISGSFAFSNSFITGGPIYNIDPGTGFWINNPNVTVTPQAGGVSVRGTLRLSAGTYNIGTAADHSLVYVGGSSIIIEGGALHIAGQLTRNNATATTSYNQSGGSVTVVEQGSTDPTFGGFDLGAPGSSFNMSGGTIVLRNATSAPVDYLNSALANVSGGTLQIGDANTLNAQTVRISSSRTIGNLLISNASGQSIKPTARLVSASLTVLGDITIQAGTTFDANGLNTTLGGDWVDEGTFTGANTVTFNGPGGQELTAPGGETFANLTVNKTGGTLTLNSPATINGIFSLSQGTLAIGGNTLTLNGTVNGGGVLTSAGSGTVAYNQGGAGQNVLAARYGNLVFNDFDKTLSAADTIGISGIFSPGAASGHTITGSTIDFYGGSQTIPEFVFNNFISSGSGTKTGIGTITVAGDLTNKAGVEFSGTAILNLNGTAHRNEGILSATTFSLGSGATLINNGTLTAASAISGTGALSQGASGMLNLGGTIGLTTFDASLAGNTVNYTGGAQTVLPTTYHHLTLSGSGSKALSAVSTVNGNFTLSGTATTAAATGMVIGGDFSIGSGASFDAGSFSCILGGNWNNAGTFNPGTSTFVLNGISPQTLSGSPFNNLSIANAAGVTLLTDETVGGILTLANGTFSIGAHTLALNGVISIGTGSLAGGATSNIVIGGAVPTTTLPGVTLNNLSLNRPNGISLGGDLTINGTLTMVNGTLSTGANTVILGPVALLAEVPGQTVAGNVSTTRNVTATSGTETFGNIGADIILNGAAPGSTTVLRKTGLSSSGNGHNSIARYFEITPQVNTGLNAALVFHYEDAEINGQDSGALEMYRSRDAGTTWNNLGGLVDTVSRTIVIAGINDFSRWTAADTVNSIGNTANPTTSGITPISKTIGDPGFTLMVNGSEFVDGKSAVFFNGDLRATTYVNSTRLTASIPASDLLVVGAFPVTVFNTGGGGVSNAQTFTVLSLPATTVRVETAADGSGTIVPAQSLSSGASITVYAVARDSLNHFVENVAADLWGLDDLTGGVVAGDLVPASDNKSAVFTGHVVGTASIRASSGTLVAVPSGVLAVTPGTAVMVRVETAADGSGTVVPAQTLESGSSLTVYSITRDLSENFVENVAAQSWMLENITGDVVPGDLVAGADGRSAIFAAHLAGSANIAALSGTLGTTNSGTITVSPLTGIENGNQILTYTLSQNYPNPFNPTTTIEFAIPEPGYVSLTVYNIAGQEVATLVSENLDRGRHTYRFDGHGLASGIYYYRLTAGSFSKVHRMVLLR